MSRGTKKQSKGSRWHPARISGHQKMLRAKAANEEFEDEQKKKKSRKEIKPLDITKSDWSKK